MKQKWMFFCKSLAFSKRPWSWERLRAGGEGGNRGWHQWLNGHEFEQTLGDSERQESLACCSPWSHRVGYDWVTEQQQQHKKLTYVILEAEKSSRSTLLAGDPEELMGLSSILEAGVFRIQEESIFLFESKERKILMFHLKYSGRRYFVLAS